MCFKTLSMNFKTCLKHAFSRLQWCQNGVGCGAWTCFTGSTRLSAGGRHAVRRVGACAARMAQLPSRSPSARCMATPTLKHGGRKTAIVTLEKTRENSSNQIRRFYAHRCISTRFEDLPKLRSEPSWIRTEIRSQRWAVRRLQRATFQRSTVKRHYTQYRMSNAFTYCISSAYIVCQTTF